MSDNQKGNWMRDEVVQIVLDTANDAKQRQEEALALAKRVYPSDNELHEKILLAIYAQGKLAGLLFRAMEIPDNKRGGKS